MVRTVAEFISSAIFLTESAYLSSVGRESRRMHRSEHKITGGEVSELAIQSGHYIIAKFIQSA
jgi:hemerythrin